MTDRPRQTTVTLSRIAAELGVHISTVSLALRGDPRVAKGTRAKVEKVARELGYRRDPVNFALSARRRGRRGSTALPRIYFVTNRPSMEDFNRVRHMPDFYAGACEQAARMGFQCELRITGDPSFRVADLVEELRQQRSPGLILGALRQDLPIPEFDWSNCAVVKIDSWFTAPDMTRVGHDARQIVRTAVDAMRDLGYRRIGLAVGRFDDVGSDRTYSGTILAEDYLAGLPFAPPLYLDYNYDRAEVAVRFRDWVEAHQLDGVISNFGSIDEIVGDAGFEDRTQLGCACLCLDESRIDLAGVVLDHKRVGAAAVEMIALEMKTGGAEKKPRRATIHVEGIWKSGPSAPPRS